MRTVGWIDVKPEKKVEAEAPKKVATDEKPEKKVKSNKK